MDRAERNGLGIAIVVHALLLAALSIKLMPSARIPLKTDTMQVQIVDRIGLQSAAPTSEAPARSAAPEISKPEESAPPESAPPEPAPPKPEPPKPEPPKPQPKPEPAKAEPKPAPPKPRPKPKPAPPKPEPKPAPAKEAPKKPAEKPAPAKPSKADRQTEKNSETGKAAPARPKQASSAAGEGSKAGKKTSGLTLDEIMKGVKPEKSPGKAQTPRAAKLDARSIAGLAAAIAAQVKPCYQIPTGGAGSEQIVTILDLRMARDGSVSSATVTGHTGVTPANEDYVRQMDEAAKRAVLRCAPLRLPAELYDVGDGNGWNNISFRFTPAQMN